MLVKYMENFEEAEKLDQLKNKMLKYILYKKRTEMEVRQKFSQEDEIIVEDAIEYFKELNYINDLNYIERSIQEFKNLKNLSIKEISYKLCEKGISKRLLDVYIDAHKDELLEYELASAQAIWNKKSQLTDDDNLDKIKDFLYKKGYTQETLEMIKEK